MFSALSQILALAIMARGQVQIWKTYAKSYAKSSPRRRVKAKTPETLAQGFYYHSYAYFIISSSYPFISVV